MKLCTILKILFLALAASFGESSLAYGQISGTVTAPGFDPQSAELAPERTTDLAAAAETAIEGGDHRKAFAHYMSICANAEAWACLRAADYFEQGCEYGDVFSCQKLGYAYLTGTFVDVDVDRARVFLQRACDAGATASCKDIPAPG